MLDLKEFDEKVYRILIVDDDRNVLVALHNTLRRAEEFKCEIMVAEDGNAAWSELKKQEFDLVMSDYRMPNLNGVDLLTRVRDTHPNTIRVLITGLSDIEIAKDAINKAAVHFFFDKPWDSNELRSVISKVLKFRYQWDSNAGQCAEAAILDIPLGIIPARLRGF